MDESLARELEEMAEQQVQAAGAFFAQVGGDPGLAAECRERLGWDPSQDPAEVWSEGPPRCSRC